MALPELKPGRAKCLKCDNHFDSRDVVTNRICPKCTRDNSKEYIPRISASRVYSGDGGSVAVEADDGRD